MQGLRETGGPFYAQPTRLPMHRSHHRPSPQNVAQITSGFCTLFVSKLLLKNQNATSFWQHCGHIYTNPSHSPAPMRIILQNNPLKHCIFAPCCSTQPTRGSLIPCARIPNVTWVQLCLRFQQIAKHRVDQHPAVTAVPETPRAPIKLPCVKVASDDKNFEPSFSQTFRNGKTQHAVAVCVRSSFVPA